MTKKKLLVLVVAYNHEKFIEKVLRRIKQDITQNYEIEILINDDSSTDRTLEVTKNYIEKNKDKNFKYTILSNPENQGYGGNQKIGFLYAIKNKFDYVALLHGDGQYAPEYLDRLTKTLDQEDIDAVFGSRMLDKGGALKGGMPLYKFIGNKVLTFYQNFMFSKSFSEFHSGYRVYKVNSLKKIPFYLNSNDHSFDNEIIAQFLIANLKIKEIAIPTYYGDEISYVNGFKYAYQVFKINMKAKLQKLGIFYDKKFDCGVDVKENYVTKTSFESTHSKALNIIKENTNVLDIGCNKGEIGSMLKNKNCNVSGIDIFDKNQIKELDNYIQCDLDQSLPELNYEELDYILILDVIEHLKNPELFMSRLKNKLKYNEKVTILISTPNVAFIVIRLMLLIGMFNYGSRGILDRTHMRLFTFSSFNNFIEQSNFKIRKIYGIPAPFELALGNNIISKILTKINLFLIKISKSLFSFQIFFEISPKVSLDRLLEKAKSNASNK